MGATLAEVLQHFGPAYLRAHALSTAQAKAWRAIVSCRTPALGGQMLRCDGCQREQWRWHSCRNRHCPQCQSQARQAWQQARLAELLDVPYCHLVFTLPHELNALAAMHPRWVYETLMRCTAQTLTEFAASQRWLGGVGAFTLVLHTWTQDLRRHLHVNALMACGALQQGSLEAGRTDRWVVPRQGERFLFPVHALSRVFRGKFLAALDDASGTAHLPRDPAATRAERAQRSRALRAHDWVVYAKAPLGGPASVLQYLARYTHRTAIGNERLQAIEGGQVRLRVRVNSPAGQPAGKRSVSIDGVQFIARLMQHVLPPGFKRIRHYGLLAAPCKATRLAQARALLQMPQPNAQAAKEASAFMLRVRALDIGRCGHCANGRWQVVAECRADRLALARLAPASCRGPP